VVLAHAGGQLEQSGLPHHLQVVALFVHVTSVAHHEVSLLNCTVALFVKPLPNIMRSFFVLHISISNRKMALMCSEI